MQMDHQPRLNQWLISGLGPGGLGFESGTPKNPNPFHRGIPGIQIYPLLQGLLRQKKQILGPINAKKMKRCRLLGCPPGT